MTVYYLAIGLAAIAVLNMFPAVKLEVIEHFRHLDTSSGIGRWAQLVMLVGGIKLAYVVYLVQVPDWSTTWVAMLLNVVVAFGYAVMLGIVMLAPADHHMIEWFNLEAVHRSNYDALWCFLVLMLTGTLIYCFYRTSVRWHKECQLAAEQDSEEGLL